jgi:hypothetical protein
MDSPGVYDRLEERPREPHVLLDYCLRIPATGGHSWTKTSPNRWAKPLRLSIFGLSGPQKLAKSATFSIIQYRYRLHAPFPHARSSAGILEQSVGARNRVEIGLSYRSDRLHRLAESNPWNRFLVSLKV